MVYLAFTYMHFMQTRNIILLVLIISMAFPARMLAGKMPFPKGKVTSPVICDADSLHTYSVYLPSYFDEEEVWPVIFIFDPAGLGKQAMEYFAPGAEEFGYILAASNTTENGPWDSFLRGANAMFEDVEKKFPVDDYRRYTAGFSGSAEAASGLAVMYDGIIGVIGCGSGFSPNYAPHFDIDFHYFGIIGNRDFHYQQMQKLQQSLAKHNIEHYIEVYPGGHEWPPASVIREAYLFMEFKAMKHYLARLSDGLIMNFYTDHMKMADSLEAAGDIPGAYRETIKILTYLDDLKRLDQVEEKKNRYLKSPLLQQHMEEVNRTATLEKAYIDTYLRAFDSFKQSYIDGMTPTQPIKWWKKQIKAVDHMITGKNAGSDSLLGYRLKDFIWRTAYAYFKSVEGTGFYSLAIQYLDIWKLVQPGTISAYYFSAKYYIYFGRTDKAINSLKMAVKNGLRDPLLLENEPIFERLHDDPGYRSILQQLWAGQDTLQ
jgi:tetratricopeptide (TPR) repeat protein